MATIVIDEKTQAGKEMMNIIKSLQNISESIKILSDEDMEDFLLGKIMQEIETNEYVSEEEIMQVLNR